MAYHQKMLMEVKMKITGNSWTNLHKLLTNNSYFTDIDLVRNLQLVPNQIKLLKKTTLTDLVFVSKKNDLTANSTSLNNITTVFLDQESKLNLYDKSKNLSQELNITFDELVKLSNLSKDELLNSKTSILDKIRKMFYINSHVIKLQKYKEILLSYNANISITLSNSKLMKDLNVFSLKDLKDLDKKVLKQMLVNENRMVFTEKLTIRNLSAFFEIGLEQMRNKSVTEVLTEILNINLANFASMYKLTPQQMNTIKRATISSVNNSDDASLLGLTRAILKSYAGKYFFMKLFIVFPIRINE